MPQDTIDRTRLQRLMAQGRLIIENLSQNETPKFHWNDVTRWQASAIKLIESVDESLLDDITKLSVMFGQSEIFGAITSTMLALMTLAGSGTETPALTQDRSSISAPGPKDTKAQSKSVFIVHGHDEAMKQSVARFISDVGLTPVVLHEQPNRGQTIIEKFEQNAAQAGFAVVLMSPDDVGASVAKPRSKRFRARQNVVVELGYFTGVLGRSRISVLVSHDVEIPSDYMGLVYTPFDPGGAWRLTLANELRASGYEISMSALLR
jgi:predicted nucleotide-binding protein